MRARAIVRRLVAFLLRRPAPAPRPSAFTLFWLRRGVHVTDVTAAELEDDLNARLRGVEPGGGWTRSRIDGERVHVDESLPWTRRRNRRSF